MKKLYWNLSVTFLLLSLVVILSPGEVSTHCDGLDGPVVLAAQRALESGDINPVLIWVQPEDEDLIKEAFKKAEEIRKLNPDAKAMADMYFYETLVRVHRAGEGAPYTGLKPGGRDLGPAIPAADKALKDGNIENVTLIITQTLREGLAEHFHNVLAKKDFAKDDLEAGREFVEAYVMYIHYVEGLYEAALSKAEGHFPEEAVEHEGH